MNPHRHRKAGPTRKTPGERERARQRIELIEMDVYGDDAMAVLYADPYITSLYGEPVL